MRFSDADEPAECLDEQALALHFEVALSCATPQVVGDLAQTDRYRRSAALSTLAHFLAARMRGFEVKPVDVPRRPQPLPLFPDIGQEAP